MSMAITPYLNITGRLCTAFFCLMLLFPHPDVAASDRASDEFLTGYVASILERDLHWGRNSLLLALEANIAVIDETFGKKLRYSLELAIKTGARRIFENSWRTQTFGMRVMSWLSYGLVRFMTGMTGYAQGKNSGQA